MPFKRKLKKNQKQGNNFISQLIYIRTAIKKKIFKIKGNNIKPKLI